MLDECQKKALSILGIDHLRAFTLAVRRSHAHTEPETRVRVVPLLSRDITLARLLKQTPGNKVKSVCAELLDLHAKALATARADGSFTKLATQLAAEIIATLAAKIPPAFDMRREDVGVEVAACLEQGWHPQVAGGIVIHRILENPMRYLRRIDPPSSYHSSAPYRVSRSECRR